MNRLCPSARGATSHRQLKTIVAQAVKRSTKSKSRGAPGKGFGAVSTKPDISSLRCPCDTGLKYGECCQPYHQGAPITTPEYVLRSRYSGFVLEEAEFLATTYHPNSPYNKGSRLQTIKKDRDYSRRLDFMGLQMEEVVYLSADEATIRLQVRVQDRRANEPAPFTRTEVSTFVRLERGWVFKDSVVEAEMLDDEDEDEDGEGEEGRAAGEGAGAEAAQKSA